MNKKKIRRPKKKDNKALKVIMIVICVILALAIGGIVAKETGALNALLDKVISEPEVKTEVPWSVTVDDTGETSYEDISRLEDSYNFLVVGKDNVALNTDVMMIINLDLEENSITIMQLPRDTLVTLDGSVRKLNSVYGAYYNAASASNDEDRIRAGMEGLASFLSENLAIQIDYYANMDLNGFSAIVDAIGGVDMYVPYRMHYNDPAQDLYIDLYEGQQTLNGEQAEQFVRFRSGFVQADTARQDSQKIFMTAFIENFQQKVSITNISTIVKEVLSNLTYSLDTEECIYFAKTALSLDLNNITMLSAPSNGVIYNGASYVVVQRSAMYEVVNEHFNLYDTDIPESSFDVDRNFTLTNDSTINYYYNLETEFEGEYTAEDIENNGIDIALVY